MSAAKPAAPTAGKHKLTRDDDDSAEKSAKKAKTRVEKAPAS